VEAGVEPAGIEPAGVDRRERDGGAARPDAGDDEEGTTPRHAAVRQRVRDRQVALDGDDAQVQDGRRTAGQLGTPVDSCSATASCRRTRRSFADVDVVTLSALNAGRGSGLDAAKAEVRHAVQQVTSHEIQK